MHCYLSSLETSPITDTDLAKRTVFQRSYSVVASEYDKQHSILPARVKAIPRRRVNSGDAGKDINFASCENILLFVWMYMLLCFFVIPVQSQIWVLVQSTDQNFLELSDRGFSKKTLPPVITTRSQRDMAGAFLLPSVLAVTFRKSFSFERVRPIFLLLLFLYFLPAAFFFCISFCFWSVLSQWAPSPLCTMGTPPPFKCSAF